MKPMAFLFFAAIAFFLQADVSCDDAFSKFPDTENMPLLLQKIGEQLKSLGELHNVTLSNGALGNSPLEVGLKVFMNAFEIFTIASGAHLFIPKEELKRDMQVSAIASANLCVNLTTMGEMYRAIVNASLFTGAELLLEPASADKAPERLFEVLEQIVNDSSTLKDIYAKEKADVDQEPLPPIAEGTVDFQNILPAQTLLSMAAIYQYYPRIRYFAVNSIFAFWMYNGNATVPEFHTLAKSLETLATKSKNAEVVNKLFVSAIEKTAEELEPMKFNIHTFSRIANTTLYSNIRKVFAEDAEMSINDELQAQIDSTLPTVNDGVPATYNSPYYH